MLVVDLIAHSMTEELDGLNVTIEAPQDKGLVALIIGELSRLGGYITRFDTYRARSTGKLIVTMIVHDVSEEDICLLFENVIGVEIIEFGTGYTQG